MKQPTISRRGVLATLAGALAAGFELTPEGLWRRTKLIDIPKSVGFSPLLGLHGCPNCGVNRATVRRDKAVNWCLGRTLPDGSKHLLVEKQLVGKLIWI